MTELEKIYCPIDYPARLQRYETWYVGQIQRGRQQSEAHFQALQHAGLTEAGLAIARRIVGRTQQPDETRIREGSVVAYAVNTLRGPLDPYAHQRGVVQRVRTVGNKTLYYVHWPNSVDGGPIEQWVIEDNLALVGPNQKFCKI